MKPIFFAALLLIALMFVAAFVIYFSRESDRLFYVGVTYTGNTVAEAKVLIDRVKNYTNLFVLQSGDLMVNESAVFEIGDYATSSGLHFASYFGLFDLPEQASWIGNAEQRWGQMFAGVYFGDELGGKMLDWTVMLSQATRNQTIGNQTVTIVEPNIIKIAGGTVVAVDKTYLPDSTVRVTSLVDAAETTYYANGSITIRELGLGGDFFTIENGTDKISQFESYSDVLRKNPLSNCDEAAEVFASRYREYINSLSSRWNLGSRSFPIFTADYALYWWDFKAGCDLVLGELGWNNTVAQEISLVRGAANLQGKSWGTMITWTYTEPPYLASGEDIYEQMRMSYECGAEYVVVFNYAKDVDKPWGILQEEHFDALERFWNVVVQNPEVVHGGVRADAVLVLPKNYGWGMRNRDDSIWGLWVPDDKSPQVWTQLQRALSTYGLRLDIIYEDPAYPVGGNYSQVFYWNQTS